LISGALAHFECEPYANYDGGDHVIFVVRVVRHATNPGAPAPLIFFRGRYRDLVDETQREPTWPLPIHY
jgi:flavin reductase (DIM6/NTAB) family NADH-FMN oxidoreductase RutF